MFFTNENMLNKLQKRESDGNLRQLTISHNIIDFCSNDYLGFTSSSKLKAKIMLLSKQYESHFSIGSTGSRLISGNSSFVESLEVFISSYHNAEAGLIFNSGYDANLGLFSSVPQRGDTVLYDELVHASIRDGIRLSFAESFSFRHNDISHLLKLLIKAKGNVYIAVESIYSMNGDFAPLKELAQIAAEKKINLIVDEAHATGVFGASGKGLVPHLQIENHVFARVYTFGKALGYHGAIVVGSNLLRNYLINFARSFIYTTAMPFHTLISIKSAYNLLLESEEIINCLFENIVLFKNKMKKINPLIPTIISESQIQTILIEGNNKVKSVSERICDAGFDVRPIMSPTVPKGTERLRICIHSFNTKDEIVRLVNAIYKNIN